MSRIHLAAGGVGLALVGLPVLGRAYRGLFSRDPAPAPVATALEGGALGSDDPLAPREAPPTSEQLEAIRSAWLECAFGRTAREERLACLRQRLGGTRVGPEALVELSCGNVVLDPDADVLVEFAVGSWPVEEAFDNVLRCAALCPRTADRWPAVVDAWAASDARGSSAFAARVRTRNLFDGSNDLLPLRLAVLFARRGDEELQHRLGAGARGALGGSQAQVAFAIEACALLLDRPARLDFLADLIQAPTFQGRELETTTLVHFLLESSVVTLDPRRVFVLIQGLLRDPRSRTATAACVLTLEDWHCLPAELGEENRASLLGLARKFAPKG